MRKVIKLSIYVALTGLGGLLVALIRLLFVMASEETTVFEQRLIYVAIALIGVAAITGIIDLCRSTKHQEALELIEEWTDIIYEQHWQPFVKNSQTAPFWWCQLYHLGGLFRFIANLMAFWLIALVSYVVMFQEGVSESVLMMLYDFLAAFMVLEICFKIVFQRLNSMNVIGWQEISWVLKKAIMIILLSVVPGCTLVYTDTQLFLLVILVVLFLGSGRSIQWFVKRKIIRAIHYQSVDTSLPLRQQTIAIDSIDLGRFNNVLSIASLVTEQITRKPFKSTNCVRQKEMDWATQTNVYLKTRYGGCLMALPLTEYFYFLQAKKYVKQNDRRSAPNEKD